MNEDNTLGISYIFEDKFRLIVICSIVLAELLGLVFLILKKSILGGALLAMPILGVLGIIFFQRPKLLIFTTVTLMSALPVQHSLFPIEVPSYLVFLMFAAGLAIFLVKQPNKLVEKRFGAFIEDKLFILFMLSLLFSIFVSLANGHKVKNIAAAFLILFFYTGYLVGRVYMDDETDWKRLKWILLISVFPASFELLYQIPYAELFGIARLLFLQTFTILIAFVIALNELAYGRQSVKGKLFYNLVALTAIITIFVSLNRTNWVIYTLAVLMLYFWWASVLKIEMKPILNTFVIWILGIMLTLLILPSKFGLGFLISLIQRVYTFSNLGRDISVVLRKFDIATVAKLIGDSPIWGHGMGAEMWRPWRHKFTTFIDNDYMVVMWHYGLLGLASLLAFWLSGIWDSYKLMRSVEKHEFKILYITTTTVGLLFLVNSLAETIFTTRPHIAIYMMMVGMGVTRYRVLTPGSSEN